MCPKVRVKLFDLSTKSPREFPPLGSAVTSSKNGCVRARGCPVLPAESRFSVSVSGYPASMSQTHLLSPRARSRHSPPKPFFILNHQVLLLKSAIPSWRVLLPISFPKECLELVKDSLVRSLSPHLFCPCVLLLNYFS